MYDLSGEKPKDANDQGRKRIIIYKPREVTTGILVYIFPDFNIYKCILNKGGIILFILFYKILFSLIKMFSSKSVCTCHFLMEK